MVHARTVCLVRNVSSEVQIITILAVNSHKLDQAYGESGSRAPCKFGDYLKIDVHDLMTYI